MKKKGQNLSMIEGLIVGMVTVGIVLVVGFLIMAEGKTQVTSLTECNDTNYENNSYACNGTNVTITAMESIAPWLPIVIVVTIGAFLIALVSVFRRR